MNFIEKVWRSNFVSPDRRDICSWASENIKFGPTSPFPGFFDVENVPWTRRLYEAFQDPKVRRITISGAPQVSGKTVFAQVCMAWVPVNDPAPMGFYADTGIKAGQFRETRWKPMQDICEQLESRIKNDTKGQTVFKDGSFLLLMGAESEANRQSHTLRVVFKDEAWEYDQGWSEQIDNRTKAFQRTNDWKIVELGTGGVAGHDFANNHALGTDEVYKVPCEHCGDYYEYKWDVRDGGVFRWDEKTKPDGSIDYKNTLETVHIECPHCEGKIFFDHATQRAAALQGRWEPRNEDADGTSVSVTIPAFVPGLDWKEFVENWIRIGKGRNVGQRAALQNLIMFDLAEFWEDRPIVEKKDLPRGEYTRQEMIEGKWDREVVRLAACDYQHGMHGDREHFWFGVRAYAENGDSRLVDAGRVDEASELNERLLAAGVQPVDPENIQFSRVSVDCAFKQGTIFELCLKYNWSAIRGEDRDTKNKSGQFLHTIKVSRSGPPLKVWKNFSEIKWGEVGVGKTSMFSGYAPWRSINNQGIEDMLYELRTGRALDWTVPSDIDDFCPEYAEHLASHAKINVSKDPRREDYKWTTVGDPRTNPDHLYDIEKYLVGQALVAELVEDISEHKK